MDKFPCDWIPELGWIASTMYFRQEGVPEVFQHAADSVAQIWIKIPKEFVHGKKNVLMGAVLQLMLACL